MGGSRATRETGGEAENGDFVIRQYYLTVRFCQFSSFRRDAPSLQADCEVQRTPADALGPDRPLELT
jgi:hypothetical protein